MDNTTILQALIQRLRDPSRPKLEAIEAGGVAEVCIGQAKWHLRRMRGQERPPVQEVCRGQQRVVRTHRAAGNKAYLIACHGD